MTSLTFLHFLLWPFLSLLTIFVRIPLSEVPKPSITLEEAVGQLFLVGVSGTRFSDEQQAKLADTPFGNFLLFRDNIGTDEQVRQLTASLSATNRSPVWIAVDQEGGSVVRVDSDPTAAISQQSLVEPEQAYEVARARGNHLQSLGISLPLSPVVDHANSARAGLSDRSFPHDWGQLGDAMVRGYRRSGVVPVVKHFPSYGDLQGDVEASIPHKTLSATEIAIFRQALQHAPVLMISPIIVDNLDPNLPAPLSPTVIRYIRRELDFQGVILTDDAQMRAVRRDYTPDIFAVAALEAGVDMVMFSGTWEDAQSAFHRILEKAQAEPQLKKRLIESAERIIRFK